MLGRFLTLVAMSCSVLCSSKSICIIRMIVLGHDPVAIVPLIASR